MKLRRQHFLWMVLLMLVLLAGWAMSTQTSFLSEERQTMPSHVTIRVGQQGGDWVQMYPDAIKVNDKNAHGRVVFYDIDWVQTVSNRAKGEVRIENDRFSFTVFDVLHVMGTAVPGRFHEDGIEKFKLILSLTPHKTESHQEAQQKFYALLKTIQKAGWKREIGPSLSRISGRDSLVYSQLVESSLSIDANYLPTFKEWMMIKDRSRWKFYANDVYLEVIFTRDSKQMDPDKPGAYVVSLRFESANARQRSYFRGEERLRWKELYPQERQRYEAMRPIAEQKIRAEGKYKIDEDYHDPDSGRPEGMTLHSGEIPLSKPQAPLQSTNMSGI